MKIHQGSDFHLEFGRDNLEVPGGADTLVLNGDIVVVYHINKYLTGITSVKWRFKKLYRRYERFFKECSERYPNVIYVLGNHEHYHFDFDRTALVLKNWFAQLGLTNIHVLENQAVVLDGIKFFGATFWTDMRKSDPMVMWDVKRGMNDCKYIRYRPDHFEMVGYDPGYMTPQEMVREHDYSFKRLKEELSSDHPTIVVTHHAPSYQSIPRRFSLDNLAFAYASNYDDFLEMSDNILVWFHGHTHDKFKYKVGETLISCWPRGYFSSNNKKVLRNYKVQELIVEI